MNLLRRAIYLTLGCISMLFGVAIIGWVLYNELIERQPGFEPSPLAELPVVGLIFHLGIAPALCYVGWKWVLKGIKRPELREREDLEFRIR